MADVKKIVLIKTYSINIQKPNENQIQKMIKKVLKKHNLYLAKGKNLEYINPKYANYQVNIDYKICGKKN